MIPVPVLDVLRIGAPMDYWNEVCDDGDRLDHGYVECLLKFGDDILKLRSHSESVK